MGFKRDSDKENAHLQKNFNSEHLSRRKLNIPVFTKNTHKRQNHKQRSQRKFVIDDDEQQCS